jgi:hypothetical protein
LHLTASGSGTVGKDEGILHLWGIAWDIKS